MNAAVWLRSPLSLCSNRTAPPPIDAIAPMFLIAIRNFYEKDSQSSHFYFLWETFVIWLVVVIT